MVSSDFGAVRYPGRFVEEDSLAARKQRRHRTTLFIVGIVAVILEVLSWLSGLSGMGTWPQVARVLFVVSIGFLGLELFRSSSKKLEIPWYDARAAAESIKTIYWRYIVHAEPFAATQPRNESEVALLRRIEDVLTGLGKSPESRTELAEQEVLDWAWAVRTSDIEQRVSFYVRERVEEQSSWYARKSDLLRVYARRASYVAISAAVLAFALSILSFWSDSAGSWSEVLFEVSVVVFGYAAIRNYRRDSRVYEFTRQEIETAARQIHTQVSQSEWARLVDEIEEVFSREHVTWQASHSGEIRRPSPAGG